MEEFATLVKTVGPNLAILIAAVAVLWKFIQRQAAQAEAREAANQARQDVREAADRAERQRAWDIHAASVKTMTDAHGVAMKDVASSVATMATAVTGVTEAVRNCRNNGR